MDQSRAINALAPFVALAKSANSPRAAADLITQATSATNTYVFAELLQQPNIQSVAGHEQYGNFYTLLQIFSWGTWESYKATPNLPPLSEQQATKLRLLSLLSISSATTARSLAYASLATTLDLPSPADLEQLITGAIYAGLITGTLNPAAQTVTISSVAPMRDLAPGSVQSMIAELAAWSGRCDSVLADLEAEIRKVKSEAEKRAKREARTEKQVKAVMEKDGKEGGALNSTRSGNARGGKKEQDEDDYDDDMMEVDDNGKTAGGRKKGASLLGRFGRTAGRD